MVVCELDVTRNQCLEDVATWAANIRLGREWKGASLDFCALFLRWKQTISGSARPAPSVCGLLCQLTYLNVYGLRYSCDLIMNEVIGET
jgi:hypothetical protein